MKSRHLQATFIYNPAAGPADFSQALDQVQETWQAAGWSITRQRTAYPGQATILAQAAAQAGHQVVLAAGGDGTMGEVATGLVHSDTAMAPLPTGTGNSLARELAIPQPQGQAGERLLAAGRALLNGRIHTIDMGLTLTNAEKKHWLLWTGAGIDSLLVDQMEPRSKWLKKLGPFGYALKGLPLLATFRGLPATIQVDQRRFQGTFVMMVISNCRRYAGGELVLNPGGKLDDGRFELWLFAGHGPRDILRYAPALFRGRHQQQSGVTVVQGQRFSLQPAHPLPTHRDGDPAETTPLTAHILPQALHLLVPAQAPADLFVGAGRPLGKINR